MIEHDILVEQLLSYTDEEKYYMRCMELQQPMELRSSFSGFSDDQTRVIIERHPRFRPCPPHTHDFFEIFYVMEGTCRHQLDDRKYILHKGDVGFLAPGAVHTLEITDDSIVFSIYMESLCYPKRKMVRCKDRYKEVKLQYSQYHTKDMW